MATFFNSFTDTQFPSLNTLFNFSPLDSKVQNHLVNVYTTLTIMMGLASLGGYLTLVYPFLLSLTTIASIACFGSIISLVFISQTQTRLRMGLLFQFSFMKGILLGPLLYSTFHYHPGVITIAFVSTALAFLSFTASAIFSPRRSYLFLGGLLGTGLLASTVFSFANIFIRSTGINTAILYLGILVFSGYVIYDTQIIVERASKGQADVVTDCLTLFTDLIALFVRMIIILRNQQEKKERKERERRRH